MFDAIIAFSLRQRALIGLFTLALVAAGIWAFSVLPIDAVPDVTNNQVQILTQAPALSSLEVERFVSFPIEIALKSIPNLVELRSLSRPGLSVVTVVFEEGEDIYFARQQILEKLREAEEEMPPGAERPELAPVSTGLGEIYRYVIRDTTGTLSPMDLRTVQDWIVRRQLLGTPGIAEVNALGGYAKQYHVLVNPDALISYNLTLRDVFDAVSRTSGNAGAGYIETGAEQYSVRSVGLATSAEDLSSTVIRATSTGVPVTLGDVASVVTGPALRFGSASQDGKGEVVTGVTMQLKGANSRITVGAVKERIEEIRPSLPPGVVIEPYYDREALVDRTISTVITNLAEGALLVVFVLLLFLANLRAGLILASVIPLAMMFAGILMVLTGQSGNLMSLGAIDFGLVVDGSLIIVENVLRMLDERFRKSNNIPLEPGEMRNLVYSGSVEVRKAAQFGEIIIMVVYLPILTLQGIEGKMFRPMALTVAFALLGALILSVTYVPMMLSLFLKRKGPIRHSPIITFIQRFYRPMLDRALRLRWAILGVTAVLLAASVMVFTQLGGEFLPRLDEGDIAMHLIRLPSVSLTESQKMATRVEKELMEFDEVKTVVSHTGRAEISTDPMGFELADVFIILKPREEWQSGRTKAELVEAMSEKLEHVPGVGVQFLQPIEMRVNELIAGARGDVTVKVVGEDYDVMGPIAAKIAQALNSTEGAADVAMEETGGLPQLLVRPDRAAIARHGLTVDDVNSIVQTAIGGEKAGEVYEGEKRFDVVVRYEQAARNDVEAIRNLMVATPGGARVALSSLAAVTIENGPGQISREDGTRFVTVQSNVRGRDVESFVEEVRGKITESVQLPAGYNIEYGGQFENLQAASQRLMIVVPIALLLIFLLLFQTFRSVRLGVMIFLCVPMAIIGGVAALVIGGMPFSISAGVGFIALFGIAVLNGIVMVAAIRKYQADGLKRREAILVGADERLRPVITTAALAGFGFVPMMLASGAGAEVQRPLAAVIIGGLVSSTLLTLFVLPIIYDWMGGKYIEGREETGGEIAIDDAEPPRGGPGPVATGLTVLLLMLIGGTAAMAQTPLTLETLRERAVAISPEMRRAQAEIERGRAERSAIGILPNPEIFFNVDEAPSPALTGRSNTALGISQSFEYPGVYGARSRVADIQIRQAEAEREVSRRDLYYRATVLYADLVAAYTLLDLADSSVAVADEFSRLTTRRRELGETTALEPLQASIALSNARQRRSAALVEVNRAAAAVRGLILAPLDEPIITSERLRVTPVTMSFSELERTYLQNHPRLAASRLAVDAARARQEIIGYEKYPTFGLEYSAQTVDGSAGFYGGGLRVGVPLWRLMSDAPDRAAQAETEVRSLELVRDSVLIASSLRSMYAGYLSLLQSTAGYTERLLPQAREAARIALRLFQEGEATYLEVLVAQSALIETETAYTELLRQIERARIDMEFVVGGETR